MFEAPAFAEYGSTVIQPNETAFSSVKGTEDTIYKSRPPILLDSVTYVYTTFNNHVQMRVVTRIKQDNLRTVRSFPLAPGFVRISLNLKGV